MGRFSSRLQERTHLAAEDVLLLAGILLLPWLFGGVELWAHRGAALLIVAAAGLACWRGGLQGLGLGPGDRRWLLPAFALALLALIQLVPLPPGVLARVSPETHAEYVAAIPGYAGNAAGDTLATLEQRAAERSEVAAAPESPAPRPWELDAEPFSRWRPLSLLPPATRDSLLWFVALLLAFLLARVRAGDAKRARAYRTALFASFAGLACFGLLQAMFWNGKLYGIRPLLVDAQPFGPYVNPNHFSGVMELAVPWLAGYAWAEYRSTRARHRAWLGLEVAAVCVVAAVAAGSRIGIMILGAALVALAIGGVRGARRRLATAALALVAVAAAALILSATPLGEEFTSYAQRLDEDHVAELRGTAWEASLGLLGDFPLVGAGFGAFGEVFPHHLPAGTNRHWNAAHNDYLELAVEGGAIAVALMVWLLWGFARRAAREAVTERRQLSPERLGLLAGIGALAVHALFDFNHQIPSNAALFVVACGLAVPLREEPDDGRDGIANPAAPFRTAWLVVVVLVVGLYGYRAVEGTVAGAAFIRGSLLEDEGSLSRASRALDRAAVGQDRPRALRKSGKLWIRRWDRQVRRKGLDGADPSYLAAAARRYLDYLRIAPASWRPWAGLAEVYRRTERVAAAGGGETAEPAAGVGRHGTIAIGLYHQAIERAPTWYELRDDLAVLQWELGFEQRALDSVHAADRMRPVFTARRFSDLDNAEVLAAFAEGSWEHLGEVPLVSRTEQLISLGKVERSLGNLGKAAAALKIALELPGDDLDRAATRFELGLVHRDAGRPEEAQASFEAAANHPAFRSASMAELARLARGDGDPSRALALLRQIRWERPAYALEFAEVAAELGETDEAVTTLRSAHLSFPEDTRIGKALARAYLDSGRITSAAKLVEELERRLGLEEMRGLRAALDRESARRGDQGR